MLICKFCHSNNYLANGVCVEHSTSRAAYLTPMPIQPMTIPKGAKYKKDQWKPSSTIQTCLTKTIKKSHITKDPTKDLDFVVSEIIKEARLALELTQKGFAKRAKTSFETIKSLEDGTLITKIIKQAKQEAINEYLKSEEGKVYLDYQELKRQAKQEIIETMEKLITEEILICQKENTPTSRLTSLAVKLKTLKD